MPYNEEDWYHIPERYLDYEDKVDYFYSMSKDD